MNILITGAAGFIGADVCRKLLKKGESVLGLDNLNEYYDSKLKKDRLKNIENCTKNFIGKWRFVQCDLLNTQLLKSIFLEFKPSVVVNFAAQAGVRYSITNPKSYIQSNIVGFENILEHCVEHKIENFIYASSSSVYGNSLIKPFSEDQSADHPLSLYAATKRSNELIAHAYSNIHNLAATGLRFFTVYGPWGRPDMAPFIFTNKIINGEHLSVYSYGNAQRDFTYIDDISEAVCLCCYKKATSNKKFDFENPQVSSSFAPHKIFNIGNSQPVNILQFIGFIEKELGIKAKIKLEPLQKGDVDLTYADTNKLKSWINFVPKTSTQEGVKLFINWYKEYFNVNC